MELQNHQVIPMYNHIGIAVSQNFLNLTAFMTCQQDNLAARIIRQTPGKLLFIHPANTYTCATLKTTLDPHDT